MNEPLTPEELHRLDGYPGPYVEGDTTGEPCEYRCKTCKWWGKPHTEPATVHRECGNEKKLGEGVMREAMDVLLPEPEQSDVVTLYCGPDFGCVHHERKKP